MTEINKTCARCQCDLDLSDFYKDPRRKDGYGSYCKLCCKEVSHESYQRRRQAIIANRQALRNSRKPLVDIPKGYKQCTKCLTVKPMTIEYFYRNHTYKCGFEARCMDCIKEIRRITRKADFTTPSAEYKEQPLEQESSTFQPIELDDGAVIT